MNTITLRQIQQKFLAYLLQGKQTILPEIVTTPKISAIKRLDVYAVAYELRLLEILSQHYPNLKKMLGEKKFTQLGKAYIKANPSHHFSIRLFGQQLATFLAVHADTYPVINKEMAEFEWHIAEVTDAADAPMVTIEEFSKIPPEQWYALQLTLHPSARYQAFYSNVLPLWQALERGQKKPRVVYQPDPIFILFWRHHQQSYFMPLQAAQLAMMMGFMEKQNFGDICERLMDYMSEEEVITFAASNLRGWVEQGVCQWAS